MNPIKELLKESCDGCSSNYCFIREIVSSDSKYSQRLIMQMKMVEVLKLIESKKQNKDVGWQGAMTVWVESGLAKKFAEVYSEDISVRDMKKKMFNE